MQIVRRPMSHPDADALCAAVQAEYVTLYGGGDSSPIHPDDFEPPGGAFLVGYVGGRAVASAGWRRLSAEQAASNLPTAEIKRVYVDPAYRCRGLARDIVLALERDAHTAGIDRLVLETGPMQPAAIQLYRRLGYTDTTGGGWSQYAGYPGVVIVELLLPRQA